MPAALPRTLLLTVAVCVTTGGLYPRLASADETSEKQKKQAVANLKQAEIGAAEFVETDDLLVYTTLPAERAKVLAAQLQKTYLLARKVLQYDAKEQAWTGKLTYYYLTESKHFKSYMRAVVGESPKDLEYHTVLKGDAPFVLHVAEAATPAAQQEAFAEAASLVAVATLDAKTGTGAALPSWARTGFGRSVVLRADGANSPRMTAFRTKAKPLVFGGSGKPPAKLADVWDGGTDGAVLATSLVDFLAFGPKAADFPKVVSGLKPGENNTPPVLPMALETATGMKWMDLETAWKKWVQSGK
jgi:hypothetical protein